MGCNKGGGCGAGDVAGILSQNGLSENERDNGLEWGEEDSKELRVLVEEPSGVNTAGQSMFAVVQCVKQLCELCN